MLLCDPATAPHSPAMSLRPSLWLLTLLFCGLTLAGAGAEAGAARPHTDTTGWFAFTIPWADASRTYTDASDLLLDAPGQDAATLIASRGFVVTDANGHFIFSNTGQRARFWGTNLTFSAAFPPSPDFPAGSGEFSDAQAAQKLAAHLAKLGFNAVRLHHIDSGDRPWGIWLDRDVDTQQIDPVQLGRLDYLIYQLKQHGIYVDLNLHVSREFVLGDGVTAADSFAAGDISYNKGATLYDPIMIGLQQHYAAQLLHHVNPYTGLRYADDPVILTTETTNEDSFFLSWVFDQINHDPTDPASFPAFYSQELDGWSDLAVAGSSLNRLRNPGFENNLTDWWTYTSGTAAATFTAAASGAYAGSKALKAQVTQSDGVGWHVQVGQSDLALQQGKSYRLRFAVRASQATTIQGYVMRDAAPWDTLGWSQTLNVGTGWSLITVEFVATATTYGQARVSFDLGQAARTIWFDAFEFREAEPTPGWHGWLRNLYGSTAAIQTAWAPVDPAPETEMLSNGSFETGLSPWGTSATAPAAATFSNDTTTASAGTRSLRVAVSQVDGTNWHVQAWQGGLGLQAGQTYRLSFDAKASVAGEIGANVMQNHSPWQGLGLWGGADLTTAWQSFAFVFEAAATDADARVSFDLGQAVRTIWIDNVSLKPHNPWGLLAGESLEANNIARIRRSEMAAYTDQRLRDTLRFYEETQRAYFTAMRAYIQQILGSNALNTGTASYIDSLADIRSMADLDFVDTHTYSDHPSWPSTAPWSPTGWVIDNDPWVNAPFTNLFDVAASAVQGKPFTVTEFNQPFPNRYAVEAPILMATIANLQDWDAVFQFDYTSDQNDVDAEQVTGFFALAGNPLATALMPVASRIFLGQQTAAAPASSSLVFTAQERYDSARYGWSGGVGEYLREAKGVQRAALFGSRLRIGDLDAATPAAPALPTPAGPIYVSGGGQLRWDVSAPTRGLYSFDADQAQGMVGFLNGRTVALSRLQVTGAADTAHFAAVTLQSGDGEPLAESTRLLLGVFTRVENTGMVWNAAETTLDDRWGGPPTLIEPMRLTVTLTLPAAVDLQVWALDAAGALDHQLSPQVLAADRLQLALDTGVDETIWYAVLRPLSPPQMQFLPLLQNLRLSWTETPGADRYELYRSLTQPYFNPTTPYETITGLSFTDANVLGDAGTHHFYLLRAVNDFAASEFAPRFGEMEFALAAGSQ